MMVERPKKTIIEKQRAMEDEERGLYRYTRVRTTTITRYTYINIIHGQGSCTLVLFGVGRKRCMLAATSITSPLFIRTRVIGGSLVSCLLRSSLSPEDMLFYSRISQSDQSFE